MKKFIFLFILLAGLAFVAFKNKDRFVKTKKYDGESFKKEVFMQDFDKGLPLDKPIYAVVSARKKTKILEIIDKRSKENINSKGYHWVASAVRSKGSNFWKVTFREHSITPKYICKTEVNSKTGKSTELYCHFSNEPQNPNLK